MKRKPFDGLAAIERRAYRREAVLTVLIVVSVLGIVVFAVNYFNGGGAC